MNNLTILWLDDIRDPINILRKNQIQKHLLKTNNITIIY